MVFKPIADRTRWEGLLVCFWLVVFDMLLIIWAVRRPIDWLKFFFVFLAVMSLPVLFYWAYRTWGAFSLRYAVERGGLIVRWAGERRTISYDRIRQLVLGGATGRRRVNPLYWPAPHLGPTLLDQEDEQARATVLLATVPPAACMVVQTDQGAYALSPAEREAFVDALQARYAVFEPQDVAPAEEVLFWARATGGHRAGPLLIAAGLLGVLVLVGVLMVNFPSLPDTLALQYSSDGIPLAIRSKSTLFLLPIIGFLAWFVNGIGGVVMAVRNQPTGAYLLWGGTIVVQVCSLLALISIIP